MPDPDQLQLFLDRLTHDLREPLRSIVSFSQLLSDVPHNPPDERVLMEIADGAERIRAITEAVSRFSSTLLQDESPSAASLQLALDMTAMSLDSKLEACRAKLSGSELPRVQVSLVHLGILFENLILNSLVFRAEDQPEIRVSARHEPAGCWLVSVEDNGMGIDQADCETVFEPFTRLHGRKYPGVGMGLAICRNIVRNHGGRIWIEPAAIRGTVCRFTLPAAD
jgi:signal transduction histidine kinase